MGSFKSITLWFSFKYSQTYLRQQPMGLDESCRDRQVVAVEGYPLWPLPKALHPISPSDWPISIYVTSLPGQF